MPYIAKRLDQMLSNARHLLSADDQAALAGIGLAFVKGPDGQTWLAIK
jgi:hypothetical protein